MSEFDQQPTHELKDFEVYGHNITEIEKISKGDLVFACSNRDGSNDILSLQQLVIKLDNCAKDFKTNTMDRISEKDSINTIIYNDPTVLEILSKYQDNTKIIQILDLDNDRMKKLIKEPPQEKDMTNLQKEIINLYKGVVYKSEYGIIRDKINSNKTSYHDGLHPLLVAEKWRFLGIADGYHPIDIEKGYAKVRLYAYGPYFIRDIFVNPPDPGCHVCLFWCFKQFDGMYPMVFPMFKFGRSMSDSMVPTQGFISSFKATVYIPDIPIDLLQTKTIDKKIYPIPVYIGKDESFDTKYVKSRGILRRRLPKDEDISAYKKQYKNDLLSIFIK